MFRLFGQNGLYIYSSVAMLAANIQVLKGTQLYFCHTPIALGTIAFSSVYLCTSLLTEHYGSKAAQQNVGLCFAAQIIMTLLMLLAIGHQPLPTNNLVPGTEHMPPAEQAMTTLFTPSPRLLLSSLLSFSVSQLLAIACIKLLKRYPLFIKHGNVWLSSTTFMLLASVADTTTFSLLAWKVLSPNPASLQVIFYTYILWTLISQLFVVLLASPTTYLSCRWR
jgi:uncharacterized integral membrane protein (TIGR00697 family)